MKHEPVQPRFIINKVNSNKQLIYPSQTSNYVLRKWGRMDFTSGEPDWLQKMRDSDGGGEEVADLDVAA
jgi:hypothetical protein